MARSAASAAGLVGRFYEFSLLGLVSSGYFAILGSGFLEAPVAALTGAGLLLRALAALRVVRLEITPRAVAAVTLLYIAFCPVDYYFLSRDFLRTTVHLVCFLAVVKILTAKTSRDFVWVKIIAFLQLLAAAILSASLTFFLFLALFLLFGVATFASSEIHSSARRAVLIARGGLGRFHVRLAALSLFISAGVLFFAATFFFVLPRTAHAAFQRFAPQHFHLPGFSDEVRLGAIGEVLRQNATVMRVRFRDEKRPLQLRWRGAALSRFDGHRWFNPERAGTVLPVREGRVILGTDEQRRREGWRVTYEVQLKAIGSDVLFFAGIPEVLWIDSPAVLRTGADTYRIGTAGADSLRYFAISLLFGAASSTSAPPDPAPPASDFQQLPALDPRIPALAREMTAGTTSDEERALAIERTLRTGYRYTLELPSGAPPDPLAHFLFERREGHCEYFASSMAVMLRTLGIPARIITGFHGGVFNRMSGWYVIGTSDAHSWVEAWLPGRGWTTFDPTPADPASRQASLWSRLLLIVDAAEMFWQDWVVDYDLERQLALATRMGSSGRGFGTLWFERARLAALGWKARLGNWFRSYGVAVLSLAAAVILAARYGPKAWRMWKARAGLRRVLRGEAQAADATLLYARMLSLLERRGIYKPPWLTPGEFAGLIPPSPAAEIVRNLTLAYNELRFGGNLEVAPRITALLEQLQKSG